MKVAAVLSRALLGIATRTVTAILVASLFVFVGIEISIPGGFRAVLLPTGDTQSERAQRLISTYHLDDHVVLRWLRWVADVGRGDFGRSLRAGESITDVISHRLPISLEIVLVATFVTVILGISFGLLMVALAHRRSGKVLSVLVSIAQSTPVYITPLFLILFFAVRQGWLPASGWVRISDSIGQNLKHLILPIAGLVLAEVGIVARIVRSEVMRMLDQDFITAARGKGLSMRYILFRHALRPASLGLLNVLGVNIGSLLSGALVIEIIFGIGALGRVTLEAVLSRDLYMVVGITTYLVIVYSALNAIVDVLMRLLDPRISRG